MDTDKNKAYEILFILDKISEQLTYEIKKLKRKMNLHEFKPELRQSTLNFYEGTLVPLFERKKQLSLIDIRKNTKKKRNTIQNYLSELFRAKYINKIKNEKGDKRTKLFEKII